VFADNKGKNTMNPGTSKQHKPAFDPLKKDTFDSNRRDNYDSQKKDQLSHHTLPKMQFPNFAGDQPRIWINKCNNYFSMYSIPQSLWVTAATMHLEDNAAKWWGAYKLSNPNVPWKEFYQDIQAKFDSDDYRSALTELINLKQIGTVEEYIQF
jgi:hypothetical protein